MERSNPKRVNHVCIHATLLKVSPLQSPFWIVSDTLTSDEWRRRNFCSNRVNHHIGRRVSRAVFAVFGSTRRRSYHGAISFGVRPSSTKATQPAAIAAASLSFSPAPSAVGAGAGSDNESARPTAAALQVTMTACLLRFHLIITRRRERQKTSRDAYPSIDSTSSRAKYYRH